MPIKGEPLWNETDRIAALRSFEILDTSPEPAFEDVARLAGHACDAPIAIISFVDENRQWFKSAIGLTARETPLSQSICAHAIRHGGLFVVPDTLEDERFACNPLVVGAPHLRFYAGVVLQSADALPLGMLSVLDRNPRPLGLTGLQIETLSVLAQSVVRELELRRSSARSERQNVLFEAALENMSHGLSFFDEQKRLLVCNSRYAKLYKLTPELTRPGTALEDIVDYRYANGTGPEMTRAEYLERNSVVGAVGSIGIPLPMMDGRIIAINRQPLPEGGWVATHIDVTDAKIAEDARKTAEERYRLATWATQDAIYDFDILTNILSWGASATELLGWSEFDIEPAVEWWKGNIHIDDQARVADAVADVIKGSSSLWSAEYRFKRGDGTYADIFDRGHVIRDESGRAVRMVGAMQDLTERRRTEAHLRISEERLRIATDAAGIGIFDIDLKTGTRIWSSGIYDMLGLPKSATPSQSLFLGLVHPEDLPDVQATAQEGWPRTTNPDGALRIARSDTGAERWIVTTAKSVLGPEGQPIRITGTMRDVTERKQAEDALRTSEERLRLALSAGRMVAWERDLRTDYVCRSDEALSLLGLGSGPYKQFVDRVHPHDRPALRAFLDTVETRADTLEVRYLWPEGAMRWLGFRAKKVDESTLVGVVFDVTERKSAEEEAWRLANHDPLTGLPNRALFHQRFVEALASAKTNGTSVSVLLLDLDEFKDVNDTLGHDAGDALLKEVARRLKLMLRDCDTVARIGGDEFGIIVVEPLSFDNAKSLGGHIIAELRKPFQYETVTLSGKASIGVAAFPDHDRSIPNLMKDADVALYRAKAKGRNRAVGYRPEMRLKIEERAHLFQEVRDGLRNDQFVPFYQPKVCIATGEVVGFEALARWIHPFRGILTPNVFGAAVQDPDIAEHMGEQMIRKVAKDVSGWLARGLECGPVAINVSSAEIRNPGFADFVMSIWSAAKLPYRYLEIEVTETVFLGSGVQNVKNALRRFRECGVKLALDDFGTGYASLVHLKQFEVDHIKIDQTFVRGLIENPQDEAIVSAVIALGASFGMAVIAEGVETDEQAVRLKNLGCPFAQGYLYAKPIASSRIPWFLNNQAKLRSGTTRRSA